MIKPEFNRMITSSWVSQKTFMSPLAKWNPKDLSNTIDVWDLKERKIIQTLKGDHAARRALGVEGQLHLRIHYQQGAAMRCGSSG